MVRIFFGNRSYALLFLPFIIGGLYACNHFTGYHASEEQLNFGFWGIINSPFSLLSDCAAMLLIFINAVLINTLFNRNEFMEKNNFLTSMFYVCFMSFFPSFYHLDGQSIAQTLLVLSLIQIFKLNQNQDGRRAVFNASILFGTACTFFPVLLIGTPFLFWIIWVLRPFVLRESILVLMGFTVPLIYTGVYSYVFQTRLERDQFSSSSAEIHLLDMIVLGSGVLLLLLMSAKSLITKLRVSSIRLKKLFRIIGLLIGLSVGIIVLEFFVFDKLAANGLLLFPLAFFFPYALGEKKPKVLPTLTFYLVILFSVGKFFIPFDQLAF